MWYQVNQLLKRGNNIHQIIFAFFSAYYSLQNPLHRRRRRTEPHSISNCCAGEAFGGSAGGWREWTRARGRSHFGQRWGCGGCIKDQRSRWIVVFAIFSCLFWLLIASPCFGYLFPNPCFCFCVFVMFFVFCLEFQNIRFVISTFTPISFIVLLPPPSLPSRSR